MKINFILFITALLVSCGKKNHQNSSDSKNKNEKVLTVELTEEQRRLAEKLGLKIEGETIFTISGNKVDIEKLKLKNSLNDSRLEIENPGQGQILDSQNFYLAKEDFNIPKLLKKHPSYDGRGVIVGGIDDGVSPSLSGLKKTTDGKRKFLNRTASTNFFQYQLKAVGENGSFQNATDFTSSYEEKFDSAFEVVLDIETKKDLESKKFDINGDESFDEINLSLFEKGDSVQMCVDINLSKKIEKEECLRPFKESGDYIYWDKKSLRELTFEYDKESKVIKLSEGEENGDSHGEGVASVMAGHKIGGQFDGVAPGAQYLDYDLSQRTNEFDINSAYTIGTFIRALEWMGQNGAEVVNISYSLYFFNAASQIFMKRAIQKLVDKYNFVVSFSAGNNGPGLGSHNRGAIYPKDVLVAGAFLNKTLDENVHGVTGLPDEGQVVFYSSIGPGIHRGAGPTVISPLSSLTHGSGTEGYGAFAGTSSASPALAGAAAVLISAAKQKGYKIDAGAIVHALRLSAKKLEGIPFVVQGTGLPKVDKALTIYSDIISGKRFKNIGIETSEDAEKEMAGEGFLFKTSMQSGIQEKRISLKGYISKISPVETAQKLLETIDIKYSHDFIKGAKNLWVSTGESGFYITIDLDQAKELDQEVFAEIQLVSKNSGEVLQRIPVTVINDKILNKKIIMEGELGAHSGHRLHLNVPKGVNAVGIRILEGTNVTSSVRANIYNSSRVQVNYFRGLNPGKVIFHKVEESGSMQFTLARYGGTANKQKFNYEVFPISVELNNDFIDSYIPEIEFMNHEKTLDVDVIVKKYQSPIGKKSHYFYYDDEEKKARPFSLEVEINEVGEYVFKHNLKFDQGTNYYRLSCLHEYIEDGELKFDGSNRTKEFKKEELPIKVTFKCFPFDYDSEKYFSGIEIIGSVSKVQEDLIVKAARIPNDTSVVKLKTDIFETGQSYEVFIKPVLEGMRAEEISLGVVEGID